jgi:sugar O-acyltransferase (sialic acid O-acetyltransferase NeuD family)
MNDLGPLAVLGMGRGSAELIDFLHETTPGSQLTVLDDRWPAVPEQFMGHPVAGTLDRARELAASGHHVALGIANASRPALRREIGVRLGLPESAWLSYAHPSARVSKTARVGAGTIVYPGAQVAVNAQIGRWALLYFNAVVHHDARVGDGAVLCAGVLLAGGVVVGDGAYLGIGALVKQELRIGAGALVGAGAVVTEDVPDAAVVAGVPARALPR